MSDPITRLFYDKRVTILKIGIEIGDEPAHVVSVLTQWIDKAH
jgi:hypothetical protein